MSAWTSASEGLAKFLAARELDRQRALAEDIELSDRRYRRERDTKDDARADKQLELQQAAERRLTKIQEQAQKDAETQRRFQRGLVLRQTAQPASDFAREDVENLREFGLDQGIIKQHAGISTPVGLPSQQASPDAIPTLPTQRALPIVPERFESLGGTEYQEKMRGDEARRELAAQTQASIDERARLDRESRENQSRDMMDLRRDLAAIAANRGNTLTSNARLNAIFKIQGAWDRANATGRELKRQTDQMNIAMQNIAQGKNPVGAGQTIINTFNKIQDPLSVVRESEYLRSIVGQPLIDQMQAFLDQKMSGGVGVSPQVLGQLVSISNQFMQRYQQGMAGLRARTEQTAKEANIPTNLIFEDEALHLGTDPAQPGAAPTMTIRRKQ